MKKWLMIGLVLVMAGITYAQIPQQEISRLITSLVDWREQAVSPGVSFPSTCRTYWDTSGNFRYSCNGAPFATLGAGTVTGSGAATEIAVWTSASNISGYTDFTWDDTNRMFNTGSISTITPTVTDSAILASSNTTLDGSNGFIVNSGTLGTNGASILNGSGYSAIVGSVSALIDQGAVYTGLLGTSGSSIIAGGYSAIIGSSCSSIGGDSITDGCGTTTPTIASYYAALAGTSFGVISGGTYVFIGGASQTAIYDGSTYSAIIGTSDARMGTIGGAGASYSAIAGGQGSMGDNVFYSFIGGGAGSIGDGCNSCAILGDGTVDAGSLSNAVAINGGHATTSNTTAIGTTNDNFFAISESANISTGTTGSFLAGDVTISGAGSTGVIALAGFGAITIGQFGDGPVSIQGTGNTTIGDGSIGSMILNLTGSSAINTTPTSGTDIGTFIVNAIGSTTVGNNDVGSIILNSGTTVLGDDNNANIVLNAVGSTTYGNSVNAVFTLNTSGIMTIANGVSSTIVIDAGGNIGTVSHSNALLLTAGTSTTQANNSVSIGISTTPEITIKAASVAMGGATVTTLGTTIFTGLGASTNGSMIYCSDCDPTATLLACTHVAAQTGAFAHRVNGAWKCIG